MSSAMMFDVEMPVDEAAWLQCESMVRAQAFNFARKYRCMNELDDMISEATVGFVRAFNSFDADRGAAFESWAFTKVRSALLEYVRVRARRMAKSGPVMPIEDDEAMSYSQRSFADVMDSIELSEDAKDLVNLILQAAPAIRIEVSASNPLRSLRHFMREQYGWSEIRSSITFDEIQEALSE